MPTPCSNSKMQSGRPLSRKIATAIASGLLMGSTLLTPFTSNAYAAPIVGTSAAVRGKVFVTTKGASRKAQVQDSIKLQDQVLTKNDSALQILLLDRSTFTVGQNCEMLIDKFVYNPTTSVGQVSAKVAKGAFRFMSGNIGNNNPTNATVSTPSATIGIRGTFFEGIVGIDAVVLAQLGNIDVSQAVSALASIIILRGPGRNKNTLDTVGIVEVSNSAGSLTLNQPNYAVFVPSPGAAPIGPFRITEAMQSYLNFFLRSQPNGPTENPLGISDDGSSESGQKGFQEPAPNSDGTIFDLMDGIKDPNTLGEEPPIVVPDPPTTGGSSSDGSYSSDK